LRIETGEHGGRINGIDTDAENIFAVTPSDDKTVRVWSLSDGRLLRVLRLPIDQGHGGKAYAVAISPDGTTVAVGGLMGTEGHYNVFLFDRASGRVKQRLTDLPKPTFCLTYSPDGRRFAASLAGYGIRVFDAGHGYQPLPSDTKYGDSSYSAVFDRSGRLITTSYDGFTRLYAGDRFDAPIAHYGAPGRYPQSAAFSPDRTQVAVGDGESSEVVVLSSRTLKPLFKPDTAGIPNNVAAYVGWSADGRFLFSSHRGEVRRWSNGGRGTYVDFLSATGPLRQILGLKDGRMLVAFEKGYSLIPADATGNLAIMRHGATGSQTPGLMSRDARDILVMELSGALELGVGVDSPLLVSKNGAMVQFSAFQVQPELPYSRTYRFALDQRQINIAPAVDDSLLTPITQAPGLLVTNWKNYSSAPALNGAPLRLMPHETSTSLAVVPGTDHFVLGTQWWVRLFDGSGHEVWRGRPVPDVALHLNVTGDGRLIVVAFNDGTIRWLRVSDGEEVLALFIPENGRPGGPRRVITMPRWAPTS
jgi:hypothetical protein